jgi:hypothetical protein
VVGEEDVAFPHENNRLRQGAGEKDALKANGYFQPPPHHPYRPDAPQTTTPPALMARGRAAVEVPPADLSPTYPPTYPQDFTPKPAEPP